MLAFAVFRLVCRYTTLALALDIAPCNSAILELALFKLVCKFTVFAPAELAVSLANWSIVVPPPPVFALAKAAYA